MQRASSCPMKSYVGTFVLVSLVACACACGSAPLASTTHTSSLEVSPRLAARRIAVTPIRPWEHWKVAATDVYVAHDDHKKPLIVLLEGSGCRPLFEVEPRANGQRIEHMGFFAGAAEADKQVGRVHLAFVEKRGVHSFASESQRDKPCSADYEAAVDKRERVKHISDAIQALAEQPWVGPIYVAGHSEGADVAAGVARALGKKLAGAALFGGAGASQLVDTVLEAHKTGDVTRVREAWSTVQSVMGPNPPPRWQGHSIARWRSFTVDSTPLDDMHAAKDLPLFVAHGSRDVNSPIEAADLFIVELLRTYPARPIFYLRIQDGDHGMARLTEDDDGGGGARHAFESFLDWALAPKKERGVLVR